MNEFPEVISWSGKGFAKRLLPRGMSDYERGAGISDIAIYKTKDGATLKTQKGKWKASFKGKTSKWKASPEEAIKSIE